MLVVRVLRDRYLTPEVWSEEGICFCDLHSDSAYKNSKASEAHTAAKVAFKKLPIVAVEPFDCV